MVEWSFNVKTGIFLFLGSRGWWIFLASAKLYFGFIKIKPNITNIWCPRRVDWFQSRSHINSQPQVGARMYPDFDQWIKSARTRPTPIRNPPKLENFLPIPYLRTSAAHDSAGPGEILLGKYSNQASLARPHLQLFFLPGPNISRILPHPSRAITLQK